MTLQFSFTKVRLNLLQFVMSTAPLSIFASHIFFVDSPSITPSNGASFNGSSSGSTCLQNENTGRVDENSQTIEGKHPIEQPGATTCSSTKSQPSFFSRSLFIWFDQFVHWGHEKSLLSNSDDQAWNLDEEAR